MRRVFSFRTDNGLLEYNAVLQMLKFYELSNEDSLEILGLIEFQDSIITEIREKKRVEKDSIESAKNRGTKR